MRTKNALWLCALGAGCVINPAAEPGSPAAAAPSASVAPHDTGPIPPDPPNPCLLDVVIDMQGVEVPVACAPFYLDTGDPPPTQPFGQMERPEEGDPNRVGIPAMPWNTQTAAAAPEGQR
jgi:hypothetical protein